VKIGAFLHPFGAVLLLSHKKRTANPLSVSGLGGSIMFNPKKPRIYNERVTKGYCSRAVSVVREYRTTQTIPFCYIFFLLLFCCDVSLQGQKGYIYEQTIGKT
jgi:hypothetical protein